MIESLSEYISIHMQIMMVLDVILAMILGGIIGAEREMKEKPAGLRTNMIIAGAAAVFVSMGRIIIMDFDHLIPIEGSGVDSTRILHAVVVGVGFIGAGTILKERKEDEVHYLTTAATIWMSAALGITVALKQYILAIGITIIMLIVNVAINSLGRRFFSKKDPK